MRGRVSADLDRLERYTETMLPCLEPPRRALATYRRALRTFEEAPNELGRDWVDPGAQIDAELALLHEIDRGPAALAFALRNVDRFRVAQPRWKQAHFGELDLTEALAAAHLAAPGAPSDVLVEHASCRLDPGVRLPWDDGVGAWLRGEATSPGFWVETTVGAALETVAQVDEHLIVEVGGYTRRDGTKVRGHARWRPGYADRMNRFARASTVRRIAPAARVGAKAVPFTGAAAVRAYEDLTDPTLTPGDREARLFAATAVEGGGAALGAKFGSLVGVALGAAGGPIGMVVGGVAGSTLGGIIGGVVGGIVLANAPGVVEATGRARDRARASDTRPRRDRAGSDEQPGGERCADVEAGDAAERAAA